ncbi:MAG: hypothetical protein IME93_02265 [Proteobacteria bacterium]|nr:hypothetical protein [Pseudomonadota bacterium]
MTNNNENRVIYTYLIIWFISLIVAIATSYALGFLSTMLIIVAPILIAASLGNVITRRN